MGLYARALQARRKSYIRMIIKLAFLPIELGLSLFLSWIFFSAAVAIAYDWWKPLEILISMIGWSM